jgi:8-oxo-dGTP diphosphatase
MIEVVAAVIERADRRILVGQRRRSDSSPLKWEFPGGKLRDDESPEGGLRRELQEELGAEISACVELGRVRHRYAAASAELEIRFYAVALASYQVKGRAFEQIAWVLPRELADYDFLEANRALIAQLATGRIKPAEILASSIPPAEAESGAS